MFSNKDKYKQYEESDNLIGYQEVVIPGLILELTQLNPHLEGPILEAACKESLLQCATLDSILRSTDTKLRQYSEELFNT